MGYSTYSSVDRAIYSVNTVHKSQQEIFSDTMDKLMNPMKMSIRECRDSDNHPEAFPIIIGLDVTGSMGYIPEHIIKHSLTDIIENIIKAGIPSPSIMFVAIGDHISDHYPLQVGQFESGDSELAMWLEKTHIEGRGGGNDKESYLLAWYLANNYVSTDQWDKRKQKGVLITIGDERTHPTFNNPDKIFGKGQEVTAKDLLEKVSEKWNVYHIHANDGSYSTSSFFGKAVVKDWDGYLSQHLLVVDNHENIGKEIAQLVVDSADLNKNTPLVPENKQSKEIEETKETDEIL